MPIKDKMARTMTTAPTSQTMLFMTISCSGCRLEAKPPDKINQAKSSESDEV
jgi:hypothetical protein